MNEITKIVIPDDKDYICRFCLKLSNDLIPINNCSEDIKWPRAGNLSIKKVFNKLCLKIDYANFLPNRICEQCKNCLEDFFIFVEQIESNEEILRKVYEEEIDSNSVEDDDFISSVDDHKESNNIEELEIENSSINVIEYEYDCGEIEQTISDPNSRENSDISKPFDGSKILSDDASEFSIKNPGTSIENELNSQITSDCSGIDTKIQKKKVTLRGVTKKRKKKISVPKPPVDENEEEPICIKQCIFCKRKFSNDDLRTIHYFEHVVRATEGMVPYRPICFYCGLLTDTKEELDEHITSKHQNEPELNCGDCKIRFSNTDEMKKHADKNHSENYEAKMDSELKCLICEKDFDEIGDMMKHCLEHISRRHTCITCRNIYFCAAGLNEHHRSHPQYQHKCTICKNWVRRRGIKSHMERHNTVKNLECKICKKSYSSRVHFNYHMHCHNKPANICPKCGYTTKLSKDYITHMRIHTNERPFKCTFDECGKAYKTSSSLSSHIKKHLNIKKFQCEYCDYRTSRSVGLTIHKRIHTGERPYTCKFCSKAFSRSWSLTMHLKKLHPQPD